MREAGGSDSLGLWTLDEMLLSSGRETVLRRHATVSAQKTVIILGAGASAAEGAPLQQNLFRDYFSELQAEIAAGGVRHEMDKDLTDFFFSFFGIDVSDPASSKREFPTFEEALGIIELALQRGESFKRFGGDPDDPWLQRVRNHLIFLICVILAKRLARPAVHHPHLLKTLQAAGDLMGTAFLSTNYDILIDNAITDLYRIADLDYGVDFANVSRPDGWSKPRPQRSIFLEAAWIIELALLSDMYRPDLDPKREGRNSIA